MQHELERLSATRVAAALHLICSLFAMPIYELDGAVLTGDHERGLRQRQEFGSDLVALESFVNHYHLADFIEPLPLAPRTKRRHLTKLGAAVVTVWAERLRHLLGSRTVLFYLGGSDVTLRFHVERLGSPPWAPLDPDFLRQERLKVFRASQTGLEELEFGLA